MINPNTGPVVPIPPAYKTDGTLDLEQTVSYLKFLSKNGITTIMTTAGSSQFNLLDKNEIREFNECCLHNFKGKCILGLPPLSEYHLLKEIKWYNTILFPKVPPSLMLMYPDRYYNAANIIDFFWYMADASKFSVYFHGMFMRNGRGGTYNFDSGMISSLSEHKNIKGMKEETTDLNLAYDTLSQCSSLDKDFEVIVAGGSMRRFLLLHAAGATTFLSGIGNVYPKIEIEFLKALHIGDLKLATSLIKDYEDPFFQETMKHGWHRSLRTILTMSDIMNCGNRAPFSQLTKVEKYGFRKWFETMDEQIKSGEYKNEL